MKAGYYQFAPSLFDKRGNLEKVSEKLGTADADLIVLPEFFNTGYTFSSAEEAAVQAERIPGGETTELMAAIARKKNMFICGGLPEDDGGVLYNSSVLVGPGGYIGKYRKVHLFYNEKKYFKRGDLGYPVFDMGGTKASMLICFDWFFPEAMRSCALSGAQVILHPTNLVMPYYQSASVTRALENRVFIILSNRYGKEENKGIVYNFTGASRIVTPTGDIIVSSPADKDDLRTAFIDPSLALNKKLNEMNDIFKEI